MLTFPLQPAAHSLRGKPPEELPHGLLTPPPEVLELIERERAKHPPEAFARDELWILNLWTIDWYFDNLCQEVIYRETPQGPEVLAVGYDEVCALREKVPDDEQKKLKGYLGY